MDQKKKLQVVDGQGEQKLKCFRLVPENSNVQFVKGAHVFYTLSAIFIAACIFFLATKGLNYGIDFKGGTELYLRFNEPTDAEMIRQTLKPLGYDSANVQRYGDDSKSEFLIRVQPEDLQLEGYKTMALPETIEEKLLEPLKKVMK